MTVCCTLQNA